jgi:ketosteroid isomerase-like protein
LNVTNAIASADIASNHLAPDMTPWTGETPDSLLAIGAGEYSVAEARAIVQRFAEVTTSLDIDTFVQGFTEDCIVSINERADMKGRDAVRQLMGPRFEHLAAPGSRFVCRKALRSLTGNVFGVIWLNEWIDAKAEQAMRSKGVEFWVMKGGRIARWDCSFSAWTT